MSLAKVFCSWSIAAVLLLLSITFSNSAKSEKTQLDAAIEDEDGEEGNKTSNVTLTGNPQIDYIHDPNLPFQLNGYNLSDYPFYHRVPKNINFSCDGKKDGFYASVEHKCQIYHHCLFGSRYDFICANYTAFDQRTFICQFVSDVDCPNSHMYFHRNEALYVTKSTTTAAPLGVIDRDLYSRRRPHKPKGRPRLVGEDSGGDAGIDQQVQQPTQGESPTPSPAKANDPAPVQPKRNKDVDYEDEDYFEDDWDYPARRPAGPRRRRFRKCRNGRRRGRRCRPRRPVSSYYYDDYAYDDDYDYDAYYDDVPQRKGGKRRRPLNAIPAGTSQVTSTSSSETPPPSTTTAKATTTTTTTEPPPFTSSEITVSSGPLDSDSIAALQKQREELLKTRRPSPNVRPPSLRPPRPDKTRSVSTTTTTTTTTTERVRPSTTTTTTEAPQYAYDYEYYEDDTAAVDHASSSTTTTTTTTAKPSNFLRGKLRGGNSAAAQLEKQRVQQSIQVRVTEDAGTNTNTIRRRDNSNVQTPTRILSAAPPTTSTTTTTTTPSTTTVSRPARFWQRKSSVKSISTTTAPSTTSTTTTTLAPYYQEYQDYDDVEATDPQPTAPAKPAPLPPPQQSRTSNRFQAIVNPPQHQYGTSPAAALTQVYASNAPSVAPQLQQQQSVTSSSRGHGSSLSSSSYTPPRSNKHYAMQQPQQYSQSSVSSTSNNNNNNRDRDRDSNSNSNNNYNTNSYHRQRSPSPPSPVVPKPEFISLVDEDYNNPYVSGPSGSTSPSSTRYHGGGGSSGTLGSPGYHQQHPIRFFEQHQPPSFLFGAASEYNNPQFAFPPRSYPSPSNFQPYGHSTRRFAPHLYK